MYNREPWYWPMMEPPLPTDVVPLSVPFESIDDFVTPWELEDE